MKTFNALSISGSTTAGNAATDLSRAGGLALITAIAQAKRLQPADKFLLTLGAWAIGSMIANELGGKQASKQFTYGLLAGAVQFAN